MDDSYAPLVQAMDTVTQVAKALPSAQYGPSRAGGVESNWSGIIGFVSYDRGVACKRYC